MENWRTGRRVNGIFGAHLEPEGIKGRGRIAESNVLYRFYGAAYYGSFPPIEGGRVFYGANVGGPVSLNAVPYHVPPGTQSAARPPDLRRGACEELKSMRLGPGALAESARAKERDAGALVPHSAESAALKL